MNHLIKKISFVLFIASALMEIYAAGTPAGTIIQSRSRATYTTASGTQSDTVYSAYVSIVVKQVGSFNITPAVDARSTSSDSTTVDFPFMITNSGNGPDVGKLSAVSSRGWTAQLYFDANGDGILQNGEISSGALTQSSTITADDQYKIIVRVRVPRDESLADKKDTTTIVVKSNFDSTQTNSGKYITTVQTADVRGILTGLTVDNPNPNAGTNVLYTLTFTNNGTMSATGVSIGDLFMNEFTLVSGTGTQGTFNGSGNPVSWNIGTIPPGITVSVTLLLTVNSSVNPGTILNNQMNVNYSVGSNSYSVSSNNVQITVGGILTYGVKITPFNSALSKEANDTSVYRYTVQNTGSFKDVIEIASTSSRSLSWMFFRDANNNLILDAADPQLTNSNSMMGADVDSVASGDSVRVFARTIIPRFLTDQIKDTLVVTATSSGDNAKTSIAQTITTINVPVITISKSVFPLGNQPAGSIMTYSIQYDNTGSASVNDFKVFDITPEETDYIPNSVKVNGTSVGDNTGSVSISEGPDNNKVISVNIGTVNAQVSGSVEFKVKIK